MHKKISATLLLLSGAAYGGGTIGGTGTHLESLDVLGIMSGTLEQPDLGLKKIPIPDKEFRRARLRLNTFDQTTVAHEGQSLIVIKHEGGIVDLAGEHQILPESTP